MLELRSFDTLSPDPSRSNAFALRDFILRVAPVEFGNLESRAFLVAGGEPKGSGGALTWPVDFPAATKVCNEVGNVFRVARARARVCVCVCVCVCALLLVVFPFVFSPPSSMSRLPSMHPLPPFPCPPAAESLPAKIQLMVWLSQRLRPTLITGVAGVTTTTTSVATKQLAL